MSLFCLGRSYCLPTASLVALRTAACCASQTIQAAQSQVFVALRTASEQDGRISQSDTYMVLENLTKLWQTVKALRNLDKTTPEKLRVAAARHVAMIKSVERQRQEKEESMQGLSQVLEARMTQAAHIEKKKAEVAAMKLQQKLDMIKIDPQRVQQKVMGDMLSKWEATLEGGNTSSSSSSSRAAAIAAANAVSHAASHTCTPILLLGFAVLLLHLSDASQLACACACHTTFATAWTRSFRFLRYGLVVCSSLNGSPPSAGPLVRSSALSVTRSGRPRASRPSTPFSNATEQGRRR